MSSLAFYHHKMRGFFWTAFYRCLWFLFFESMGKGCRFEGWIEIPQRGGTIRLGDQVHVCRRNQWTVLKGAELVLGQGVFLSDTVFISAHCRVSLGPHSAVAQRCSIHDNNHTFEFNGVPFLQQGFVSEPLEIGPHCWIGAHCVLVKGSGLGGHSILAAGAVLTTKLPDCSLAGGVPAKLIRVLPKGAMPGSATASKSGPHAGAALS